VSFYLRKPDNMSMSDYETLWKTKYEQSLLIDIELENRTFVEPSDRDSDKFHINKN